MDIRRNHRDMTQEQKRDFVRAILILKNEAPSVLRPGQQNRYDDFVQIHKNSMGLGGHPLVPNPHRSPLFFPWHRLLIRQFELELQAAADNPAITLPYWNWSMSGADDPFTDDFMGRDGDPAQNQRVTFGPFALKHGFFTVKIWNEISGDAGLRRNFGGGPAPLPSAQDVESVLSSTPYWSEPTGWENLAETMHNDVHAWVGGNMGEAPSPSDPVFFLHHCYLDYLWERWSRKNPTEPKITFEDNAPSGTLDSTLVFNPQSQPAPWLQPFKVADTLSPASLDYGYADL